MIISLVARGVGPILVLLLMLGLGGCGDPDPKKSAADLAAMKKTVNAELRGIAGTLREAGLNVEDAVGHVSNKGMSTYAARDYTASMTISGDGSETEQVDSAVQALTDQGWSLGQHDLEATEPWAQLSQDDFRTTISWTKHGTRKLYLELDFAGEVEVSTDEPLVDRDNSEPIDIS